ncbi:hypothetical protein WDJ51_15155 [Rathayibacter sp. YIM 133350]|uniref:hypothetical protein n=1 Tax=Rathayibacter sp. YIM 133350 TaxID=3131992 RepID=UPI00307F8F94
MSTVSIAGVPDRVGRVRVTGYEKIEAPDLRDRTAVEAIFAEATRVAKAERSRRTTWWGRSR